MYDTRIYFRKIIPEELIPNGIASIRAACITAKRDVLITLAKLSRDLRGSRLCPGRLSSLACDLRASFILDPLHAASVVVLLPTVSVPEKRGFSRPSHHAASVVSSGA